MPKHRHDPEDFEMITMSFRCFGRHSKVVHQAAESKNLSANSYMRKVVIDWAYADLGLDPPDYTALTATPSQISEAAKIRGVTVQEFTSLAVREMAARTIELAQPKPTRPPGPKSDIRELSGRSNESGTRRRMG